MKNQGEKCWTGGFWKWVVPCVDRLFAHSFLCSWSARLGAGLGAGCEAAASLCSGPLGTAHVDGFAAASGSIFFTWRVSVLGRSEQSSTQRTASPAGISSRGSGGGSLGPDSAGLAPSEAARDHLIQPLPQFLGVPGNLVPRLLEASPHLCLCVHAVPVCVHVCLRVQTPLFYKAPSHTASEPSLLSSL